MHMFSPEKILTYVEGRIPDVVSFIFSIILAIVVYFVGAKAISFICNVMKRSLQKTGVDTGVIQFLGSLVKGILYVLLVVSIAMNFGLEKSSLAALVASGGVGLSLALQGGLANLAGGILILLLKPFQVGDYIIENGEKQEGTVTKIEMFYTTLTTVDNRRITVPNGILTNSSIVNVTSQEKRKLEIKVGISYESDLKKAKALLEQLLLEEPLILSEEESVVFVDALASHAVILGFRAWVRTEHYWKTKWEMNEKIKLIFDKAEIKIPYEQLDVHIRKDA